MGEHEHREECCAIKIGPPIYMLSNKRFLSYGIPPRNLTVELTGTNGEDAIQSTIIIPKSDTSTAS